jgi:transketolase
MPIKQTKKELDRVALEVRKDIWTMLFKAGSGHAGGSLGCTDIFVALYWNILKHDPKNPNWSERDYFILSKGHCCPTLYAVLARMGYFSRDELWTLRQFGSILQGHPHRLKTPGVEASTGSLGQGFAIANGVALGLKKDGKPNRVFSLLGDGEVQEGSVWEAGMCASHYKLDNLCAVIDRNMLQIDGPTEEVMGLENLENKWEAFNWNVIVVDGHNIEELTGAYDKAIATKGKPTMILAKTTKGKGVSFVENQVDWHGKVPNKDEYERGMKELEEYERRLA